MGLLLVFTRNVGVALGLELSGSLGLYLPPLRWLVMTGSQRSQLAVDHGFLEAVRTDCEDVFPDQRGEVPPRLLRNRFPIGSQLGFGGSEIPGVEDHNGVQ